jgi:hypothetical protein
MELPFTPVEFFSVFERYNLAIFPLQLVAYAGAAAALTCIARRRPAADFVAPAVLAASWTFTGAGYFLSFFRGVSPIAVPAGALFLGQAALFVVAARGQLRFSGRRSWAGWALVAFAMVLYPAIGAGMGHGYPRSPSFGVTPCPTTIFTYGVLLLATGPVPSWLLAIPFAWSAVATSAAVSLGVVEDLALPAAAVFASVALLARRRKHHHAVADA